MSVLAVFALLNLVAVTALATAGLLYVSLLVSSDEDFQLIDLLDNLDLSDAFEVFVAPAPSPRTNCSGQLPIKIRRYG